MRNFAALSTYIEHTFINALRSNNWGEKMYVPLHFGSVQNPERGIVNKKNPEGWGLVT